MVLGGPAAEQGSAEPEGQASQRLVQDLRQYELPARDEQVWSAPQGKRSQELRMTAEQGAAEPNGQGYLSKAKRIGPVNLLVRISQSQMFLNAVDLPFYHPTQL